MGKQSKSEAVELKESIENHYQKVNRNDNMSFASLPITNGPVTEEIRHQLLQNDRSLRHDKVSRKLHNSQQWAHIRTLYRVRMQRIGLVQIILAIVCILVTFVITVFEFKESPATGLWCSIIFAAVGGLVHTASKMNRSFRVMVTFGVTNIYFGFLMFFVEFVESGVGYQHKVQLSLEFTYHVIMCGFAVFQVLLTIFAIYLCRKHDGAQIKQRSYLNFLKREVALEQLAVIEVK